MPGTEPGEGWGRMGVPGGKWSFPGGEGALGESIHSGATRLGAEGPEGWRQGALGGGLGMQRRPSSPAAQGDFKGKGMKKRKGKKEAPLSSSLGEGAMGPTGAVLGALGWHGRCCGDGVQGVLPPPFPAPRLRWGAGAELGSGWGRRGVQRGKRYPPAARGLGWRLYHADVMGLPLVQCAGRWVLSKERKCRGRGVGKGDVLGSKCVCSPPDGHRELGAPLFCCWGAGKKSCSFCLRNCWSWQGKQSWPDGGRAGGREGARQQRREGEQGARHLRKHRVRGDPWMQTQTQASSSSSHAPDSFPHAIHVTC